MKDVDPWQLFETPKQTNLPPAVKTEARGILFNRNNWNPRRALEFTDRAYEEFISGRPMLESLRSLQNFFWALEPTLAYVEKAGSKGANWRMGILLMNLSTSFATEHSRNVTYTDVKRIDAQISHLRARTDKWGWFHPKMATARQALETAFYLDGLIDSTRPHLSRMSQDSKYNPANDMQELWKQVREDRGYGIKTSFAESQVFLPKGEVFFFGDKPDIQAEAEAKRTLPQDTFALIGIGHRPGVEEEIEYRSGRVGFGLGDNPGLKFGDAHAVIRISDSGEFFNGITSYIPLERHFDAQHASDVYQVFKLFMHMRLHDLTRRADLVDVPNLKNFERDITQPWWLNLVDKILGRKKPDYRTLIIPRVKPEKYRPEDNDNKEGTTFVDSRDVIWHTRRLPEGYHASDQAKEYAAEHGVILQEGETIVKEHKRRTTRPITPQATRTKFKNK